jgi:stearoyl-CoA desaturase (delta-9 desaturase)
MPPDVCKRDRLDKVLNQLEAEAKSEELLHGQKRSLSDLDVESFEKKESSKPVEDGVIRTGPFIYVEEGAFELIWSRIAFFGILQVLHLYAIYYTLFHGNMTNLTTFMFAMALFVWSALGVTAGAHRLWSHKSYQARWPIRVFLMIGHCIAGQNSLFSWCRDHRVHHKSSETDSDPHNSKRGFFYAHVGWLLVKSHPDFIAQLKVTYIQDLLSDPIIHFQMRRYKELFVIFSIVLPIFVPVYFWGESLSMAFLLAVCLRYATCLHNTWFVNSAAHMFGERPYNQRIEPRQNPLVSFGALGEGYHNYHHTYPWDYSTSESGVGSLNVTKGFIDAMSRFGLTYDRKQVNLRK